MKLICPDCGKQYESGKFCQECGTKLQEVVPELVCPSCGYKAKSGKFCPECGTKLTEESCAPITKKNEEIVERKFNEKDERFAKYYDTKGFPRITLPQEERAIVIEELTPFAAQNIAEAKMLLGGVLMNDPDRDNVIKGASLLKEAEDAGDKFAYYFISLSYYYGWEPIVEQNHDEAEKRMLECYKDYGDGETAGLLAELYALSEKKCDYKKALEYATIAAEDDDKGGYAVLGALYLNGWGIEKNMELALENYKMAAALGDETSMNQIGFIFMGSENIEANPEQSFFWFNEAAQKGSDVGLYNLGWCYQNGFGIEKDVEKAAEYFKKAAELDYADAMFELGDYYQSILFDLDKSKAWYLKAAEMGHADAQNKLSVLYADDIEPNYDEAIKWCKKAMEQNNPWAYRNYAMLLWNGNGVKEDKNEAIKMMQKAIALGHPDAEQELKDMKEGAIVSENESIQATTPTSSPKELHIPEGTKTLSKLESPNNESNNWKSEIESLFLPSSLTKMKEELLSSLPNLCKIIIPNGEFDKYAKMLPYSWWKMYYEDGTSACPEITIHQGNLWIYNYGITSIDNGNQANGHVLIPPTCTHIGKKAFQYNDNVLSITMTDSVKAIGEKAFESCEKLEFIRLSNKLHDIPKSMLAFCKALKMISVPHGVTSIGAGAFAQCDSLTNVVLPSTVRSIDRGGSFGLNPFQYSNSLKHIVIPKGTKGDFESLLKGFNGNPARLLHEVREHKPSVVRTTQKATNLPMDDIRKAAKASYPKKSLKTLAVAALKIAEVIQERLPDTEVSYMVHPSEFDSDVQKDALPIHFLFTKDGVPKVAVVAVTENGYRTPLVLETAAACEGNGIEYVRVYADGCYADWMENDADSDTIEFCKNWLVQKICNNL